jgi:hypothetical protein
MINRRGGEEKGKEEKEGEGREGRDGMMGWGEPPKTNPGYGPAIADWLNRFFVETCIRQTFTRITCMDCYRKLSLGLNW